MYIRLQTILNQTHRVFFCKLQLEKQIEEVRDLFFDIAGMVQSQGEMVNNIANLVEKANIDVEKGKNELNEAEKSQRSARKKKIILAIILSIVILIVLLVVLEAIGVF